MLRGRAVRGSETDWAGLDEGRRKRVSLRAFMRCVCWWEQEFALVRISVSGGGSEPAGVVPFDIHTYPSIVDRYPSINMHVDTRNSISESMLVLWFIYVLHTRRS